MGTGVLRLIKIWTRYKPSLTTSYISNLNPRSIFNTLIAQDWLKKLVLKYETRCKMYFHLLKLSLTGYVFGRSWIFKLQYLTKRQSCKWIIDLYQKVIALLSYILEPSVVIAVSINGSLLSASTLKDSLIFSRLESAICDACS